VDGGQAALAKVQIYHNPLATRVSRAYLVWAAILALILLVTIFMIRLGRADLSGADSTPAGETSSPRRAHGGDGARMPKARAAATPASGSS
jgi:hypothetical protein